jgi:hypothetical protein
MAALQAASCGMLILKEEFPAGQQAENARLSEFEKNWNWFLVREIIFTS